MSQQAGYSPSFKRPAEIIRMRRKRPRSDAGPAATGSADSPGPSGPSAGCAQAVSPGQRGSSGGGAKCRNPFASVENVDGPRKRPRLCDDPRGPDDAGDDGGSKSKKWSAMEGDLESMQRGSLEDLVTHERFADAEAQEEPGPDVATVTPDAATATPVGAAAADYPADWSLKTRLLFTSPHPLSWAEKPKAQEEALGLHRHCRARFRTPPPGVSELRCAFQQALVYWQHPSLPWLSLFPRINAERSFAGQNAPWAQDVAVQRSLMREWCVSLSSLYGLLKSSLCPYFYLCSYQFTVLFRAAGVGGSGSVSALISPTTRGLREALKAEGIEFSLPLLEKRKRRRSREQEAKKREEDDEEEEEVSTEDEDGCCLSWLEEMGLRDKVKKPDGIALQPQKQSNAAALDHRPESVASVEGPHAFTLVNFLINFKHIAAAAGSQAGLPPTLLAPVAFRGAAMQMLKSRSVNAKSRVGSAYQNVSSLEITGPILPSALHAITDLLRHTQKGDFSASLYTHAPTAVMNVRTCKSESGAGPVDLSACGLAPASAEQLCQPPVLGKAALTHLRMSEHGYTWRS